MIANHTATLKLEWFNLFDCLNFGFAQPQYYICDPPCANHTSANALMNALPHLEAIEAHPVSGLEPQSACFVHVLSQEGPVWVCIKHRLVIIHILDLDANRHQ